MSISSHDALARVIWEASRADEGTISATGAQHVATAILDSDWLATREAKPALVADLRSMIESWEVLRGGWEYGTAVLAVLQEHGYFIPPGSTD